MNLRIEKIRLNELEDFVKSEIFQQFEVVPITGLRVKSYISNPYAHPGDVVLYLGFVQKQLVAFRTLLADSVNNENEKVRFAWCSGNWVHPDFRRKGFSEQLLIEALKDWDNKLMFTNYAPNSEMLYLKTGKFHAIHQFQGFRGYLFPKTMKLVKFAGKNGLTKFVFSVIDILIAFVSTARIWFCSEKQKPEIRFEKIEFPDSECYNIVPNYSLKFLFNRGEKELSWIFKFPWISDDKSFASGKYPFSSYSNSFSYKTVKVFVRNNMVGFFVFSVREGHLKTLHFNLPNGIDREVAAFLYQFCVSQKIEVVTVYKTELAQQLFAQKFPFLRTKKYGQKIYSSFKIKDIENFLFQDGDGDVIFT